MNSFISKSGIVTVARYISSPLATLLLHLLLPLPPKYSPSLSSSPIDTLYYLHPLFDIIHLVIQYLIEPHSHHVYIARDTLQKGIFLSLCGPQTTQYSIDAVSKIPSQ